MCLTTITIYHFIICFLQYFPIISHHNQSNTTLKGNLDTRGSNEFDQRSKTSPPSILVKDGSLPASTDKAPSHLLITYKQYRPFGDSVLMLNENTIGAMKDDDGIMLSAEEKILELGRLMELKIKETVRFYE